MFLRIQVLFLCFVVAVSAARAQAPAAGLAARAPSATTPATGQNVETEPISCWWRTSAGAVRVGELFTLVLTCAIVETDLTTVVADVSRLDPSVLKMPPFDVVDGKRAADLRTALRRFFQYDYTLRVISDDVMGEDVSIPALRMSYKVLSRVAKGTAANESRDRQYILPPLAIRVVSLVPATATDIRDQPRDAFSEIDTRLFRANAYFVVAIALFVAGGILLIGPLVHGWTRRRARTPEARGMVSNGAILRGVEAELATIHNDRQGAGWTPESVGRALAALRIVAGYALARPASQSAFAPGGDTRAGQLLVHAGRVGSDAVLISGSLTPEAMAEAMNQVEFRSEPAATQLSDLQTALTQLTAAAYGRSNVFDTAALNVALASGRRAARRLAQEEAWVARTLASIRRTATSLRRRFWFR